MRASLFVCIHLSISSLLLTGVSLFNYLIDGFGIFNNELITKIANHINNGKNVGNLLNIDDRTLHKIILETKNNQDEIIALGSSRIMGIGQKLFKESFFNHGMSGASLNDYAGILGLYLKTQQHIPKIIIFGLDPWVLNTNSDSRWQNFNEYVSFFYNQLSSKKSETNNRKINLLQKIKELLSLKYTLYNILLLKNKQKVVLLDNECPPCMPCFLYDGSHHETRKDSYLTNKETITRVKQYISLHPIYHLGGFTKLNTDLFEKMIDFLQKEKIKIIFFLPPYHPLAYKAIYGDKRYVNVLNAEKYFQTFAQQHNIPIIGSYNPDQANVGEEDFYDAMHLKSKALQNIFHLFFSSHN